MDGHVLGSFIPGDSHGRALRESAVTWRGPKPAHLEANALAQRN
jgi:hypothetical protein